MRSSKDQVTDVLLEGPSPSRNGWAAGFGLYSVQRALSQLRDWATCLAAGTSSQCSAA